MDMDAALKDGYSLAEVNAEAARRTGFKYDAARADGHTDEDINQELRKRLKGTQPAASPAALGIPDSTPMKYTPPKGNIMDDALAGESGLAQMGAGVLGMLSTGPLAIATNTYSSLKNEGRLPTGKEVEQAYAEGSDVFPSIIRDMSGPKGIGAGQNFGKVAEAAIPFAPLHGTIPSLSVGQGANALRSRFSKGSETSSAASRLVADLAKPNETTFSPPSTAPVGDAFSQMRQQLGGAEPEVTTTGVRTPTRDVADSLLNPPKAMENIVKDDNFALADSPPAPRGTSGDVGRQMRAQEMIDARNAEHDTIAQNLENQRRTNEELQRNRAQASNMDSSPSAEAQAHIDHIAAEEQHRAHIEETHAHALDEQNRLEAAQKAVEERQKAIDDAMSGVKSQFEGKRALEAEKSPKNPYLDFEAELRQRMAEAPAKSREVVAREMKAAAEAEKRRIVEQRAANEQMIQKLRDQHTESEIRTKQAQADAQEAISKRNDLNTSETKKAAQEAAKLRAEADALAKDKAKRDKALANIAKQHALQEITHPAGSKERAAAVKAVNEKFGKTGGPVKKSVPKSKQGGGVDPQVLKELYRGLAKGLSKLTDQPWLKSRFSSDKWMTNSDGTPMVMLHGSADTNIVGDIKGMKQGFHAGFISSPHIFVTSPGRRNKWAVHDSSRTKTGELKDSITGEVLHDNKEGGRLYPVAIKKGNYPHLNFDIGDWSPWSVVNDVRSKGAIKDALIKKGVPESAIQGMFNYVTNGIGHVDKAQRLSDVLKQAGIDGFFYRNTGESPLRQARENSIRTNYSTDKRLKILNSQAQDPTSFVTWDDGNFQSIYKPTEGEVHPIVGDDVNTSKSKESGLFGADKNGIVTMNAGLNPFSWGTRQKANAFSNIPGLKDVLRDIGNAMIATPKEAIALAQKFGDVSQNSLQKGINLLTKGGTYLKGKVDNPVVHFTVDRFLTADSKAKAEISEKLHSTYLKSLRDLSKEEYQDAFTLLNAADLNQREITPAMMQQYGLSTKLQDFITTHQTMMTDVMGKINAARVAVGKPKISARSAYSAMNMAGDYRKVAYKTVNGDKVVVGVIGADRKSGKLGWTLEKIEKHMLNKDPTLEFGPLKDTTARVGSTKGTPHEAFQDALDVLGQNNPNVQAFLDTLREVAKDDPSNYMGMQTHTMQKKGVWGMEGRKPWMNEKKNATQFFENQTKYMEGAYNWSHLAEAAKDVNEVLRDGSVAAKHENAIKMSEAYMQNALGLNPSRVGRAIDEVVNSIGNATGIGPSNIRGFLGGTKSVVNSAMLSLNPSFLAIQLIQGPAAMPAMTALLRGRGLAPKSTMLTGGLDYISSAGMTLLKDPSKLTAVERGALDYAKDNHVYAADMVEHSNTTTKGAMYYTNKITQSPAAYIEQATRAQVYMSFVKMMDDSGLTPKEGLYEQAHRLTDQSMNNYGALEKPAIYSALGPVGSMAYNLKSFGHNEISRWSMLAREIPATGNAVPLLTQMATTIAIAGAMGLPFYSQWETLYDYITSKLGEPRSLSLDTMEASEKLSKALGDDAGKFKDVMSHGAPTMLGMDVSKRIGLGDVLPNKASDVAFAGGSKLGGMVTSAIGAAIHPDEPHLKAAAVNWAPPILQGIAKDAWYTDGDMALSMDPDKPTKATAELNPTDRLLKKIGITGINESTQKERNYQLTKIDKTYQDKRDTAMAGLTFALAHGGDLDPYVNKYLDNQGDPETLVASINSAIDTIKIDPNKLAIIKDAASKSITRALSLQRRMKHQ
jgi:hypothetical protein